jgi:hypothetical protein
MMRTIAGVILLVLGLVGTAKADGPYTTAATYWPDGKAQFFLSDGTYLRYDVNASRVDPGYPKRVDNDTWPGMGGYGQHVSAAFNTLNNKVIFTLSDGTYIRYDVGSDRADPGYPKPITDETWPGLGPYGSRIISALNWNDREVQLFLSGGEYIRYDLKADRIDAGYPKPINETTWPGLAPYAKHLAGTINGANGKAYIFFDDGRYVRYDIGADQVDGGYPKPINAETWPGLSGYFRRK